MHQRKCWDSLKAARNQNNLVKYASAKPFGILFHGLEPISRYTRADDGDLSTNLHTRFLTQTNSMADVLTVRALFIGCFRTGGLSMKHLVTRISVVKHDFTRKELTCKL